jgi:hypothetical protein
VKSRILLTFLVLAGSVFAPAAAGAQVDLEDSVTGTALDCTLPPECPDPPGAGLYWSLTADARSGPAGEAPLGTMVFTERVVGGPGALTYDTNVTCLSVSGRTAIVGVAGTLTFARFGIMTWVAGHVRVIDGGGPGSGQDTFEFDLTVGPVPPFEPPSPPQPGPTDCSTFQQGGTVFSNDEGDLIVTDAQPFPSSKEQCKNGGWRNYPGFKNQGDCVSFVATKARNPRANPRRE